jgi:NADH:ubiquinone oxidoreductase subunit 6 (subunit J)
VYIYGDQPHECSIPVAQPPLYNPRRSLAHSFIEQILLPPWSNWFLAALGLIIPALVDSRGQEEKKPPSGEENPQEKRPPNGGEHSKEQKRSTVLLGQSFWQIFITSLGLSLILVAGILLVVSAIWWPNEAESGGAWNIVIIIFMLFLTILFTRRTLDLDWPPYGRGWMRNKLRWLIITAIIAFLLVLVIGFFHTRFLLLKPLIGISLAAMALEIPRAIPWLFERIKIKRLLAIVKSKGGNP